MGLVEARRASIGAKLRHWRQDLAGVPGHPAMAGDGNPAATRDDHSAAAIPTTRCFALGMFSENSAISAAIAVNTARPYNPPE